MSLRLAAASAMPGSQAAKSSARRQAAWIQNQAMPRVNLAQTSAGFIMPRSSESLLGSRQLLTLQKEYQSGIKLA